MSAYISYPDPYVQPLVLHALDEAAENCRLLSSSSELSQTTGPSLQVAAYEDIDFDHAMQNPATSLICSYVIRKALIRKHYLSNTVSTWLVKHPSSVLASSFEPCTHFELDFAEFLDDALVDAWDLNESMVRNDSIDDNVSKEWWILKPGMSDGGNGIRLFASLSDLQTIFEGWEPETDEDEESDGDQDQEELEQTAPARHTDGTMTTQLRHFIAQPYIKHPLLLPEYGNRKFHIRTYVVAVGALKVFVYREMLALFAAKHYILPGAQANELDLGQHLTNTCSQDEATKASSVHRFLDLNSMSLSSRWKDRIFEQICDISGEIFEAAAKEQMIHFQTLPNAFEIFGVDFLVDNDFNVWLLELNAYPDFKQTGASLQDSVVGGLFNAVVDVAIKPFFESGSAGDAKNHSMPLVKHIDLGRR